MNTATFYIPDTPLVLQALRRHFRVTATPCAEITHLLLPVPVFDTERAASLLKEIDPHVTVLGGRLSHPIFEHHTTIDLLENEEYLAKNAALTAEGALRLAGSRLPLQFRDVTVLVIGWGRIGKCLALQLGQLGAQVLVAARKPNDRAMIAAMGFGAVSMEQLTAVMPRCRILFNTVPVAILSKEALAFCPPDCIKIDLASVQGMEGDDVLHARGLPGKMLPEASAALIADTVVSLIEKEEVP